jgi:hypothetical protein
MHEKFDTPGYSFYSRRRNQLDAVEIAARPKRAGRTLTSRRGRWSRDGKREQKRGDEGSHRLK